VSELRSGNAPSKENRERGWFLNDGLMTESRAESPKRFLRPEPVRWLRVVFRRLQGRFCGELADEEWTDGELTDGESQEKVGVKSGPSVLA
jgi:hypothetical protein